MRATEKIVLASVIAAALLLGSRSASAQLSHNPPAEAGAAIGAATINLVYVPVRLAITTVGAIASGLTGWLTGGNADAAEEVWTVFRGPAYISPRMLQRREPFGFGPWETQR